MIQVKRIYAQPTPADGVRFLVDRLWPRGVRKDVAAVDFWLKNVAPSHQLRRWFGHGPERWQEFRQRYFAELDLNPESWRPILKASDEGPVTLLYAARDAAHNNAVALMEYLAQPAAAVRDSRFPSG